jgi:aminoglycoside phosphotransferase (APT) family kinase protein
MMPTRKIAPPPISPNFQGMPTTAASAANTRSAGPEAMSQKTDAANRSHPRSSRRTHRSPQLRAGDGHPDVTPKNVDSWVEGLAQALADLHETPLDGAEGAITGPPWAEIWPPVAGEHDSLTAAAVIAVTARLPSLTSEHVFTHGDFHPGNVLWHRGRISGVVDWSAAGLGSRWAELAYCRTEVCLLLGPDIADRLANAYSDIVGDASHELAIYDVMFVFLSRQYAAKALDAYREQGHTVSLELSLARLDEQLRRAMQRVDKQ